MKRELELGKRYTWDEVVEAYPGKWVRMNDCTFGWGNGIKEGILAGIYSDDDDETDDVWLEIRHGGEKTKNDRIERTTIGMGMGFIDCLNATMGVRDEPQA